MKTFIATYWLEFLFGALVGVVTHLLSRLRHEKSERECLKNAICALLRDRIIVIYNRYSKKEFFPIFERENLEHLTKQYYALGGNGIVKQLEQRLYSLPTGDASEVSR